MGNRIGKLKLCFTCDNSGENSFRRNESPVCMPDPVENDVGHSFFYQPQQESGGGGGGGHGGGGGGTQLNLKNATFTSISGASVSANTFTCSISTPPISLYPSGSSSFQSTDSFAAVPFQPITRRHSFHSGRVNQDSGGSVSVMGLVERAFLSGPIPTLDPFDIHSEPISKKRTLIDDSFVPMRAEKKSDWANGGIKKKMDDTFLGKAGEDRVHVVVSEENEWVFVGIYDGFNGPDATDFLHNNLYSVVHKELKRLSKGFESVDICNDGSSSNRSRHQKVLNSLSEGLRKTESCFFQVSDMMLKEHPELCLMGSCVLVMVMKSDDVYLMNVGDSRAVLGRDEFTSLSALQLTMDHSTSVEEEVKRIQEEHKDDAMAVTRGRVKGSLNITRAFGAGFLKKPKWNNAVLEPFRKEFIGNSPYINCLPNLIHHRLCSRDKFLILSSDGLYQYFTNEDAVNEVGKFLSLYPDGDPAQHLVHQVLCRAATKAGMKLDELLDIPQGDSTLGGRRMYHDDVSIIIISFQGTIWQSAM